MSERAPQLPSGNIWNGVYATWPEACGAAARASQAGAAFDSERWRQRITRQLLDYRAQVQRDGAALPPRPCNLPLVCALTTPASVIDLGGSSGWCWEYLEDSLRLHSIRSYVVLEIAPVVEHMIGAALHGPAVSFQTVDGPLESCDLLYSNSMLQYLESNELLLDVIERSAPAHVFLEDLLAQGKDDVFSVQTYYDRAIPCRFLGLHRLIAELGALGYRERVRTPYASAVLGEIKPLPMDNLPEKSRLRYGFSILFERMAP